MEGPVVGSGYQDIVLVDCNGVKHSRVLRDRSQLFTLRTLPDADLVSTSRCKRVLLRMVDQCAHSLLVMGESVKAVAFAYVPEADHLVVRT